MKKFLYMLSLLIIASMVMTACGGGQPQQRHSPLRQQQKPPRQLKLLRQLKHPPLPNRLPFPLLPL